MNENNSKEQLVLYIEKASVAILGILFLLFPLVFTNLTTDLFVLPKQIFLIFVVLALMLLFGAKTFLSEKIRLKRTPFDLPILLFVLATLLSVIFSVARYDSIFNFIPFLFAALSFFVITYNVRNDRSVKVLVLALLAGGALSSVVAFFNFLKIYVIPFDFAHSPTFTPLGSVLDQAIYLALLLPLGAYFLYPYVKKGFKNASVESQEVVSLVGIAITTLLIFVGFIVSIYSLIAVQQPIILPLATGFQTAFAAISQDSGRTIQGFLFGSGFGEFSIVFLRFKQAAFNASPTLWNLTFFRSSSFVLELLATTGFLGILSFLLICYRAVKERPIFIPLVLVLAASFILPFSFYHIVLFFFILGIYSSLRGLKSNPEYFEVELALVVSKKGFFVLSTEEVSNRNQEKYSKVLSTIVLLLIIVFSVIFGFLAYDYTLGNINFQRSLAAASQNNGSATYQYQSGVLNTLTGKYVDAYYRVFSQTNLALANSLATSVPKGSSPSAQTTQTISTLVQQSISSGRTATSLSSENSINWQNLSSVYRSLIGFGQNADSFSILAAQQAVQLDPTNPQEYINLGGIYYQLGSWDNALTQFQQAINLKPDYANSYYNHAHALIQKGNLQQALTELQTVKTLVAKDPTNSQKISDEIKALQTQISKGGTASPTTNSQLNQPQAQLPAQNPPVKIPAPQTTLTPSPQPTGSPTPSPAGK